MAAELENASVAVLPVFNLAGQNAQNDEIAASTQKSIESWLQDKRCTLVAAEKVAECCVTQNKMGLENKEQRTKAALSNIGKQLGCAFVVSTNVHCYLRNDAETIVYLYCKVLDVGSGEYRTLGVFRGSGKRATRFTSMSRVRSSATNGAVKTAMESKLAAVAVVSAAPAAAAPTPAETDPKRVVILPATNQTGKEGDEETKLAQAMNDTLAKRFTDCGFTPVSAAEVGSYLAANKINMMDDEATGTLKLAAIGSAFRAGYVVSGALLPIEDTMGMTFIWSKKRKRATIYLQVVDVQKGQAVVDGKTTDQADSSVIQGGAFERSASLREVAVMRASALALVEFLKPFEPAAAK